jgi:hypothetical protein
MTTIDFAFSTVTFPNQILTLFTNLAYSGSSTICMVGFAPTFFVVDTFGASEA